MPVIRTLGMVVLSLVICVHASAQERKAYKHVDEKGNVTYSQTPPLKGNEAKKVDISPAAQGRGGYAGSDNEYRHHYYTDQRSRANQDYQKRREEAQQKQHANLRAECERNRGTDCNNPETLRQMEAQRIPGGRSYPPR